MNGKMILEGNLKDIISDKSLEDVFFDLYNDFGGEK
jgi:hypothetical protein